MMREAGDLAEVGRDSDLTESALRDWAQLAGVGITLLLAAQGPAAVRPGAPHRCGASAATGA